MAEQTTTTTWWRCLHPGCATAGRYEQAMSGGAAERHAKATGHGTETTIRADRGEKWLR